MNKRKLLLIGWDAADWKVIDRLMAEAKLPVLSQLISSGVRGNIATLSPTLSPILWTSIATGKRAYDHGICGFVEGLPVKNEVVPVRSTTRTCKAVWNILNEAGLKTNVVNWWPSHPAEVINGVSVSQEYHKSPPPFGQEWPMANASISPPEYRETLEEFRVHPAELGLAHLLPFIQDAANLDPESDPVLKACLRILAHASSVHNAATWLMEHTDWDFMAVYQEAIDHFSHLAMKYDPPKLPEISEDDFERYKNIISAAYRFHDMMLGRLLELAGPDCDVLLLSDHGFQSGDGRIAELPDIPAAPALEHRRFGVFVASGPSFAKNTQVYGASLLDITPTILHHFSLPVGEDMEGQVLTGLYPAESQVGHIPTWEITGNEPVFLEADDDLSADMVNQLEKLGYIALPDNNKMEYVRRELLYNRSLSLLEGGHYEKLIDTVSAEWKENFELRFGLLLSQAYQNLNLPAEWQEHMEEMQIKFPGNGAVYFQRGLLAMSLNSIDEAMQQFERLEEAGIKSAQLYNEIARTYLVTGSLDNALTYFEKGLAIDTNNTTALTGMAQVMVEKGEHQKALAVLENSLGLLFFQPRAHFLMALISYHNGDKETSEKALRICLDQAPKHAAARKLLSRIRGTEDEQARDPVIVVSGWPRSGTSMMMRMLKEAGLPLYIDETRTADSFNPDGYFEHEAVKKIGENQDWIAEARGKAVKVVYPLLRYLPASENYLVIAMKRPLTDVVASQEVMKGRQREKVMNNFPFQMALNLQKEEERIERWLDSQPHMEVANVDFKNCIEEPERILQELAEFLHRELNISRAVKVPQRK